MMVSEMKKVAAFLSSLGFLASAGSVLAQSPTSIKIELSPPPGKGIDPQTPLGTIIGNLIIIIFSIAALLVLVMLIIGAIQWILSGGDKEAVGKARERITHALIGLAILALAFLIVNVVGNIVGFGNIFNIVIPPLGQR